MQSLGKPQSLCHSEVLANTSDKIRGVMACESRDMWTVLNSSSIRVVDLLPERGSGIWTEEKSRLHCDFFWQL